MDEARERNRTIDQTKKLEKMFVEKRLIQESPLVILPSLAMKIGLREAIIVQQIHYWLTTSLHVIEGRRWVYNTYKEWQKQFPFWSECTIKRSIPRGVGWKTNRIHQLMSDLEKNYCFYLEWANEVIDIREQFPISRDETLKIAERKGIAHPVDQVSKTPIMMTTDFFFAFNMAWINSAYWLTDFQEFKKIDVQSAIQMLEDRLNGSDEAVQVI